MGKPSSPEPVKLFAGVLTGYPELVPEVEFRLSDRFGTIDEESPLISFDYTDYYRDEMGEGLQRKFFSFRDLIPPEELAEIKLETNEIELSLAKDSNADAERPVNIDPGYLGPSKLVLATTKNYSHRIYLERGIYAEVTLQYENGGFRPQPWTYPDYRSDEYLDFFQGLREEYLLQLESSSG
ncbi:DUF4416 family protein [Candidatus Bipolaricaulota bacterium]|nr:DUF4416 family protein [Candidatus Bipolaricaulota bacterium]